MRRSSDVLNISRFNLKEIFSKNIINQPRSSQYKYTSACFLSTRNMAGRGLTFFAILFTGLLLFQCFKPVVPGVKLDPAKVKPTNLDVPDSIDEGIGESPSPSPTPFEPNVDPPGANFNGAATFTFNTSNYVFDESLSETDFYENLTFLDSWTSIKWFAAKLFDFANLYSTVKAKPKCTSKNQCRIRITQEGKAQKRRPDEERGMAVNNCGKIGDWKFTDFEHKHILRTSGTAWDPENFGIHAFAAAHWRRADSPYSHATFFYVPKLEVIDYTLVQNEDGEAQCKAQTHYDAWTCVKTGRNEDLYGGCYYAGKCLPTYRKVDGHFMGLDCLEGSGDPSRDYVADPFALGILQDQFAYNKKFSKVPPKQWQLDETSWFVDRTRSTGAGLRFTEPRPEPYKTTREELYDSYTEWLQRHPTEKIPEEVKRLFYRQPYYIFAKDLRKNGAPNEGFIERKFYNLKVNPLYVPAPDPAKIDVPFAWSGNRGGNGTVDKMPVIDEGPEWDLAIFNRRDEKVPHTGPDENMDSQHLISKVDDASKELAAKLNDLIAKQ